MKELNEIELLNLNGGTKACDIIAGASIGALFNVVVGVAVTIGGIGCWAHWW